jgi:Family of unknown function (DUF6588)
VRKLIAILFLLGILSYSGYAQNNSNNGNDINSTLQSLSSDAAKSYVEPVIGSFGSNLNTGWITKAPAPAKFQFSLDLKIIAMGSMLSSEPKTFSTVGSFNFTDQEAQEIAQQMDPSNAQNIKTQLLSHAWTVQFSGPTIAGSKDDHVVLDFQGQQINGQNIPNYDLTDVKGFLNNLSIFPTATIQLGIGTFMGTNVAIRWFPKVNIKDMGDFTYWGFGIMHNPAVWFENQQFPVDIALGYFYQDLKIGSIFETKAHMFGVYASKTFGSIIAFTPYIGLSTESSTTTINYVYNYNEIVNGNSVQQSANINFELDGTNSAGFTVGAAFKLAILNLNIDYKFANVKTASAGLTFGF